MIRPKLELNCDEITVTDGSFSNGSFSVTTFVCVVVVVVLLTPLLFTEGRSTTAQAYDYVTELGTT